MNRKAPRPEVVCADVTIPPDRLAVIGALARTYDAQRLRLVERAGLVDSSQAPGPVRPLTDLHPAVTLDGSAVSASISDVVTQAETLAAQGFAVPFLTLREDLMVAEAGWWDALIGDVERRIGLAPRTIRVTAADVASVQAVFADRLAP